MKEWSADFINDPNDDYNLYIEILYGDTEVAVIKPANNGPYIKWFSSPEDYIVPVEWLLGLLKQAQQRIAL